VGIGPAARLALAVALGTTALAQVPHRSVQLIGFAALPPDTFAKGPPSGAFRSPGQKDTGFPSQPVQGFSAIRPDPGRPGWWLVLCDNGYGTKANSADFLLRIYSVRPDWRTGTGGSGRVQVGRIIQLSDPDRHVPFKLVRDDSPERWLTGGDFDPESFVELADGTFWIGDEFGPYLLHVDAAGRLLAPPFEAEGLRSPDHPALAEAGADSSKFATVQRSRGFEGLALHADGTRLMAMLESAPVGDPPFTTRVLEFDLASQRFTGRSWRHRMSPRGGSATELVSYAPDWYLVVERDNAAGSEARFKFVVAIHLGEPDEERPVALIANLLGLLDPRGLAGDGVGFRFPFITPEAIWPEDARTLVLVNDNNYPGGGGRGPAGSKDASEFIRLRLREPLPH
jgi:hypothetical protein